MRAVLACMAVLVAAPAAAQGLCAPRAPIVEALGAKHDEHQSGIGVVGARTVIELFLSTTGSWSILATNASGISCIIGSGTDWQMILPPKPAVKSEPS